MQTIRFFHESDVDVDLSVISKHLTRSCTTIEFVTGHSSFTLPVAPVIYPDSYDSLPQAIKRETEGDYRAFLVTRKRYNDNFFFHTRGNLAILSLHGWEYLTSLPLNNGLVFFVAVLLSLDIDNSFRHHDYNPKPECIYDFGWHKAGVDIGMRSSMICPECMARINGLKLSEEKKGLLRDLQQILNDLGNASKWETDIVEYWEARQVRPVAPERRGRNQVFICYSHADTRWLERLKTHLKPFERGNIIHVWDDTRISTGDDWRSAIQTALEATKVAVLLVSPEFLASDFIADEELPHLLDAARNDGAVIMPIILRPCGIQRMPSISCFQSVNPPSRSLVEMTEGEQERFLLKLTENVLNHLS